MLVITTFSCYLHSTSGINVPTAQIEPQHCAYGVERLLRKLIHTFGTALRLNLCRSHIDPTCQGLRPQTPTLHLMYCYI